MEQAKVNTTSDKIEFNNINAEVVNELRNGKDSTKCIESSESINYTTPYSMHYKAVHNVDVLYFKGPSELKEAIALAYKFCQDRNWRFIQVRPMFHDILQKPQTASEREKYMTA